jgi:polyphosphate glucokinase
MKAKTKSAKSKAPSRAATKAATEPPVKAATRASTKPPAKAPQRVLVIDIGGSHVKFRVGLRAKTVKFDSGPDLSGKDMAKRVAALASKSSYDAVSIGYPGIVVRGKIAAEPYNLAPGWVHYDFEKVFGAPVRVINDAAMQAIGSYEGGRMLFLGLGTGLGTTLIFDGIVEPMEMGHMPFRDGRSFEDFVGERGRLRMGTKKWRKVVGEAVDQLSKVMEPDYIVLGGGNAKRLKTLPDKVRLGDNDNAFKGGLRLWQQGSGPLRIVTP